MTARALSHRLPLLAAMVAAALLVVTAQGLAQSEKKSQGLFKGIPQKRDEPVKITSTTLEVRDKSKMATFKGDVQVVQGDTEVRCNELVVFYDDDRDKSAAKATDLTARGQQQIRRMEARGSVVVTQKDQRAVGDRAEFDMRTNTVTLIGNVVITNADNVVRSSRMVVDLNTGIARMGETGGTGRVEGVFNAKSPPKRDKQN